MWVQMVTRSKSGATGQTCSPKMAASLLPHQLDGWNKWSLVDYLPVTLSQHDWQNGLSGSMAVSEESDFLHDGWFIPE